MPHPTTYDIMDIAFNLMWETDGQVVIDPAKYVKTIKDKLGLESRTPITVEAMESALKMYNDAEAHVKEVLEKCR